VWGRCRGVSWARHVGTRWSTMALTLTLTLTLTDTYWLTGSDCANCTDSLTLTLTQPRSQLVQTSQVGTDMDLIPSASARHAAMQSSLRFSRFSSFAQFSKVWDEHVLSRDRRRGLWAVGSRQRAAGR
jgi:hypothetical protein